MMATKLRVSNEPRKKKQGNTYIYPKNPRPIKHNAHYVF